MHPPLDEGGGAAASVTAKIIRLSIRRRRRWKKKAFPMPVTVTKQNDERVTSFGGRKTN